MSHTDVGYALDSRAASIKRLGPIRIAHLKQYYSTLK